MGQITIDNNLFLYVDGVKIGRVCPMFQRIQIKDKDKARSRKRGTDIVEIDLSELVNAVKNNCKPTDPH